MRRLAADLVAHHHRAFDGFSPGQELGLGKDRWATAARVAAVAAALPFRLQPGRPGNALDLAVASLRGLVALPRLTRLALMHDGVRRIIGSGPVVVVVTRTGL